MIDPLETIASSCLRYFDSHDTSWMCALGCLIFCLPYVHFWPLAVPSLSRSQLLRCIRVPFQGVVGGIVTDLITICLWWVYSRLLYSHCRRPELSSISAVVFVWTGVTFPPAVRSSWRPALWQLPNSGTLSITLETYSDKMYWNKYNSPQVWSHNCHNIVDLLICEFEFNKLDYWTLSGIFTPQDSGWI